jgi:hypothetical protein
MQTFINLVWARAAKTRDSNYCRFAFAFYETDAYFFHRRPGGRSDLCAAAGSKPSRSSDRTSGAAGHRVGPAVCAADARQKSVRAHKDGLTDSRAGELQAVAVADNGVLGERVEL